MGDVLSPLLFDHPAIYKTSWQRIVGHHFLTFPKAEKTKYEQLEDKQEQHKYKISSLRPDRE